MRIYSERTLWYYVFFNVNRLQLISTFRETGRKTMTFAACLVCIHSIFSAKRRKKFSKIAFTARTRRKLKNPDLIQCILRFLVSQLQLLERWLKVWPVQSNLVLSEQYPSWRLRQFVDFEERWDAWLLVDEIKHKRFDFEPLENYVGLEKLQLQVCHGLQGTWNCLIRIQTLSYQWVISESGSHSNNSDAKMRTVSEKCDQFNSFYFLHISYKIGNCRLTKRSFGENGHCKFVHDSLFEGKCPSFSGCVAEVRLIWIKIIFIYSGRVARICNVERQLAESYEELFGDICSIKPIT
jgi:hypothetical protein